MGTTDRTALQRVRRMEARKRAKGQVKVQVWCYAQHRDLVRAFAQKLRDRQEGVFLDANDVLSPIGFK